MKQSMNDEHYHVFVHTFKKIGLTQAYVARSIGIPVNRLKSYLYENSQMPELVEANIKKLLKSEIKAKIKLLQKELEVI